MSTTRRFTKLFEDRVGPAPTHAERAEMARIAKERFELFIPPGWADADYREGRWTKKSKQGEAKQHPFGDFFGWSQILDRARKPPRPVVLVTDDMKDDWWLLEPPGKLPILSAS